MDGTIRVCVNGYGVIGKRVADAVRAQKDMTLVGVTDVTTDWRSRVLQVKGIPLFAGTLEALETFKTAGIPAVGVLSQLLRQVDVVIDCTPKKVAALNVPVYRALKLKFVLQGGEKHEITGHSFVAEANYDTAVGRDSTRVVSCNTTATVRTLSALKRAGRGRFRAFSAGSFPKGEVHPRTLELLTSVGFSTDDVRSKSWDEFTGPDAPVFDFIFTVCDNAAGETCPVWPGHPMTAHWGIEDPAAHAGEGQREAFVRALHYLRNRIAMFTALPLSSIDEMALESKLRQIGQIEGSTSPRSDVA